MNAPVKSTPLRVAVMKVVSLPQWECCLKCHTPRKPDELVSGVCILCEPALISELTHMECPSCKELKREFSEVPLKVPGGTVYEKWCIDCEREFYTDRAFGWTDRE